MIPITEKLGTLSLSETFTIINDTQKHLLTFVRASHNHDYKVSDHVEIVIFLDSLWVRNGSDITYNDVMNAHWLRAKLSIAMSHFIITENSVVVNLAEWTRVCDSTKKLLLKTSNFTERNNRMYCDFEFQSIRDITLVKTLMQSELSTSLSGHLETWSWGKFANRMQAMTTIRTLLFKLKVWKEPGMGRINTDDIKRTLEELTEYMGKHQGKITSRQMKVYMKSRHDLVASEIFKFLNLDNTDTDMSPKKMFGYKGVDSNKTPDIIYEDFENNSIKIYDVAVTAADPSSIRTIKEIHYRDMVEGLSIHLGKNVTFDAIVMSISEPDSILLPKELSLSRRILVNLQNQLQALDAHIKSLPGYDNALAAFQNQVLEDKLAVKKDLMNTLVKAYETIFSMDDKESNHLSESFESTNDKLAEEVCTNDKDKMVEKMRDKIDNFNSDRVFHKLISSINNNISSGKMPLRFKRFNKKINMTTLKNNSIESQELIRKSFLTNVSYKLPRIFKYVDFTRFETNSLPVNHDVIGRYLDTLDDGTILLHTHSDLNVTSEYSSRAGIGMNLNQDLSAIEEVLNYFRSPSSADFQTRMMRYPEEDMEMWRAMSSMKLFEVCWCISRFAMNVLYMEGRRFVRGSSKTVMKHFDSDGYSIVILAGSRLTQEGQIRVKVLSQSAMEMSTAFHSLNEVEHSHVESKWLSYSSSDLRTMAMMFEKAVAMASHYLDSYEESNRMKMSNYSQIFKKKMFMMPILILMEMKRGTSTSAQYSRYIFNSMPAFISDKEEAFKDINKEPIRSVVESVLRIYQMNWAVQLYESSFKTWSMALNATTSTASDYDELMSKSLFSDGENMEFSFIMNDLYLGNLFQKEAGFMGHRSKAIISKMMTEEKHYLEIRNMETMNANLSVDDCFKKEDEKHVYSEDFIVLMSKNLAKKMKDHPNYEAKLIDKMTETVQDTMMMTHSLKSTKTFCNTIHSEEGQKNDLSFLNMDLLVDEHGTHMLHEIISRETVIEAIFSMFPKPQIGGPREILIQSYKLRAHVKFLESIFEGICDLHEKEMLTSGKNKENIQSNTAVLFKNKTIELKKVHNMHSIPISTVADASRWAPSFVMSMFILFTMSMDLPTQVREHFITVLRAFSSKTMILPNSLAKKWKNKDLDQKEAEEIMQWVRDMSSNNDFVVKVFSGMGQGMLHRMSSLIHCAKDDLMEKIISVLAMKDGIKYESVTMLSSDDLWKRSLFSCSNPKKIFEFIIKYAYIFETTNMLANIHTNWKKTAFSFVLDEFNSYFSTGKRAVMAVIKDVFTAMEIVDLTQPQEAVISIVSAISRAFRHGMFLRTARTMFYLMRKWLIKAYAMKDSFIESLMDTLNCSANLLPSAMGFLSCDHILGQMLFGNDILIFRSDNTYELTQFYKGLYTGVKTEVEDFTNEMMINSLSGKIKMELPYISDKGVKSLIESFMSANNLSMDSIMADLNETALQSDHTPLSFKAFSQFRDSYFIGTKRTYSFMSSKQLHSVVRALQFAGNKIKIKPNIIGDETIPANNFINLIMSRSKLKSSISLMLPYKEMMNCVEKVSERFDQIRESASMRHSKKRLIRFRTKELVLTTDKRDILEYLNSSKTIMSNRLSKVLHDLCDAIDVNADKFFLNPITTIKDKFSYSKWPMLMFSQMLDEFLKLRESYSAELMCSFPDQGNAADNLMAIYCERVRPDALMTAREDSKLSDDVKMINTWMALGKNLEDFPFKATRLNMTEEQKASMSIISAADTATDRLMKLSYNLHFASDSIDCSHIFHRMFKETADIDLHAYTDLNMMIMMKVDHSKKMCLMSIFSDESTPDTSSSMHKMALYDKTASQISEYTLRYWNGSEFTEIPSCTKARFKWNLSVSTKMSMWVASLRVNFPENNLTDMNDWCTTIYKNNYDIDMESVKKFVLMGQDSIKNVISLMKNEMDLITLVEFMKENGLQTEDTIMTINYESMKTQERGQGNMTETMNAFVPEFSMEQMMDLFDMSGFSGVMDSLMADEDSALAFDSNLLDDDLKNFIQGMNFEDDTFQEQFVPMAERVNINRYIAENVQRILELDAAIHYSFIRRILSQAGEERMANTIWNVLATQLKHSLPEAPDWMVKIMMTLIYVRLSREGLANTDKPKNISYLRNMPANTPALIVRGNVDNFWSLFR